MTVPSIRPAAAYGRRLAGLRDRLPEARLHGDVDVLVSGITHDSRQVRPGDLYLARAGARTHGIEHLAEAVARGAVATLTDPEASAAAQAAGQTVVEVPDPRAAGGPAAAWVYDDPSAALQVIGVTGTNGKTTTTYLLEGGLQAAGRCTGLVGTVETRVAGETLPSIRTTPEATDLQALLAVMRERRVTAVAMEVSSHALALRRIDGTSVDVAVFTNLSQDHLDFHAGMDDYFAAKARLFTPELSRSGVISVDDAWGRKLAAAAAIPVRTVGSVEGGWRWSDVRPIGMQNEVTLTSPDGGQERLNVLLPGRFNVQNAALAYVALVTAGIDPDAARDGIASVVRVPGRMERVDAGQPFVAMVDYAHTPEAVALLLAEARALAAPHGRVVVVLGCGGDRDQGKRPAMGAAAARGADVAVFTNDNPRSEEPAVILDALVAGATEVASDVVVEVEPDRRAAIGLAVAECRPGDVLVIAGKGHEQGQETAGRVVPFDDRDVLRSCLAGLAGAAGRT